MTRTHIEDAIQSMATKRGITAEQMRAVLMSALQAGPSDLAARETVRAFFEDREPVADERLGLIAVLMQLDMEKAAREKPRKK